MSIKFFVSKKKKKKKKVVVVVEIRDILADTLQSIAHDVEIEPVLLPFEGENLPGRTANRSTKIRDILADTLQSIAHDVEIEPVLLPFEGENLPGRTANRSTAARLDIRARSFWTRQQDAFFDVRVTNPKAHLHSASEVQHHLLSHEQQKKRQIGLRVTTIDRGSFTPLVFATNGMVGKECERFLKTLVGRVVEKNGDLRYSVVMNHLRTKLTMSILRWNITCFRGCRSSYTRKKSSLFVTQCRLLCPK